MMTNIIRLRKCNLKGENVIREFGKSPDIVIVLDKFNLGAIESFKDVLGCDFLSFFNASDIIENIEADKEEINKIKEEYRLIDLEELAYSIQEDDLSNLTYITSEDDVNSIIAYIK